MSAGKRVYLSRLQTLFVFLHCEWSSQNKIGNIGILALRRNRENCIIATYLLAYNVVVGFLDFLSSLYLQFGPK